jgi:hypothetical protein
MIGSNATNVEKSLDGIRERRQKFVCLNDNINHTDPNGKKVGYSHIINVEIDVSTVALDDRVQYLHTISVYKANNSTI